MTHKTNTPFGCLSIYGKWRHLLQQTRPISAATDSMMHFDMTCTGHAGLFTGFGRPKLKNDARRDLRAVHGKSLIFCE